VLLSRQATGHRVRGSGFRKSGRTSAITLGILTYRKIGPAAKQTPAAASLLNPEP